MPRVTAVLALSRWSGPNPQCSTEHPPPPAPGSATLVSLPVQGTEPGTWCGWDPPGLAPPCLASSTQHSVLQVRPGAAGVSVSLLRKAGCSVVQRGPGALGLRATGWPRPRIPGTDTVPGVYGERGCPQAALASGWRGWACPLCRAPHLSTRGSPSVIHESDLLR